MPEMKMLIGSWRMAVEITTKTQVSKASKFFFSKRSLKVSSMEPKINRHWKILVDIVLNSGWQLDNDSVVHFHISTVGLSRSFVKKLWQTCKALKSKARKGDNPTYGESIPCMALLCLKPFSILSILGEGNKRSSARSAFSPLLPPLCFRCFVCNTVASVYWQRVDGTGASFWWYEIYRSDLFSF